MAKRTHSLHGDRRPIEGAIDDCIESSEARIEICEPRIALSASLAADTLLDVLDVQPEDNQPDSQPEPADHSTESVANLIEQAADLRDSSGIDGSGQTVAVIDSGIAWDHVALGGGFGPGYRVVAGWDFAENDANPYDDGPAGFHGSHVAGLLAGDSIDVQGIVPGADLVALRVFDDDGASELEWIESALQWVHENQDAFASPITTVNLSVGAALTEENRLEATSMLADELQMLRDDQILVFAASGNFFKDLESGADDLLFPASNPSVVAVGSVDESGSLSDFSQRESGLVATRGVDISSSVPDHVFGWDGKVDDTASLSGTSMAAPQVAGASMLVRQAMINEGLQPTADEVLARMRETSQTNVDPATDNTYHAIDLLRATESQVESVPLDRFDGTTQNEHVELDLRDGITVRVGESVYKLDPNLKGETFVIDAGGGADSIQIIGSEAAERLMAYPVSAHANDDAVSSLSTNDFQIQLRGFERIEFDGGGGRDRATLYDSPGDDILESNPGSATLTGPGFRFDVSGVPRVYAHGTGGGSDSAFLYDSEGDDALAVRPQFTSLRGEETFQLAYGFERVFAYANAGGFDTANIYDSAGDDTMSVSSTRSMIAGPGYQVSARGFASVVGHAIMGGNDLAKIYADATSNQWHSTDDMVQWTGQDSAVRVARGFERTMAFEDFQPISLQPLSIGSMISAVDDDERKEQAIREADAARAVFEQLGRQ